MATGLREYDVERERYARYLHHGSNSKSGHQHETATSPLLSLRAKHLAESERLLTCESNSHVATADNDGMAPQYGRLGFNVGDETGIDDSEPILLSTNAPNSTLTCGSQGSGKS